MQVESWKSFFKEPHVRNWNMAALASPARPLRLLSSLDVLSCDQADRPVFVSSLPSLLSLTICVTKPGEDKKPLVQGAAVNSALRLVSSFLSVVSYHILPILLCRCNRLSATMLLFPGQQPRFTAYRAQNILHGGSVGNDMETGTGHCWMAAKLKRKQNAPYSVEYEEQARPWRPCALWTGIFRDSIHC